MTISLAEFLRQLTSNPAFFITVVLVLGVILVNGWTDAPNAIATCVSTRSISAKKAIIMAAIFNFLGVFVMTLISDAVASTVANMVNFGDNPKIALIALCAALVAIVVWATAAWAFGIPTSESHALIAGVSGAAIALQGGSGINGHEWIKVIYGLLLSSVLGFVLGYIPMKIVNFVCKNLDRRRTNLIFEKAQIGAGAAMAFMHGAQDGQKFMGVFLLGAFLAKGQGSVSQFIIPVWLMVLCSFVMGLGTSIGGYKIIKTVGMGMVKLGKPQGFVADFAAVTCLLLATFTGIPVSTTHTKSTAIMGVGAAKRMNSVNWGVVKEMTYAWILTFPGCGLLGFLMSYIFMKLF
jgi:PiT family inorganic phosphate transporter